MLFFKKLLSKYGIIFTFSFFGAFILLVNIRWRFGSGTESTVPGDFFVTLGKDRIVFLPFTSSLGAAALVTIMYEAYNIFKRY